MTTVQRGTRIGRDDLQVLWFGLLALLISWSVWLPLVLNGPASGHAGPSIYLHLLGSLGPAAAAFALTGIFEGKLGLRLLRRRMTTGPGRYISFAVRGPAAAFVLAFLVAVALRIDVDLSSIGAGQEFPQLPTVVYILANLCLLRLQRGSGLAWLRAAPPATRSLRAAGINDPGRPVGRVASSPVLVLSRVEFSAPDRDRRVGGEHHHRFGGVYLVLQLQPWEHRRALRYSMLPSTCSSTVRLVRM